MKKQLTPLLCYLLLFCTLTACSKPQPEELSAVLAVKGIGITQKMDQMAESESYRKLISVSPLLEETIIEIAGGDYSSPEAIYQIEISPDSISALLAQLEISDLSDTVKDELVHKLITGVPSQLVSFSGVETLAAVSTLATGESFLLEGLLESQIYLFSYDGAFSSMVIFQPQLDNIIAANAYFVPSAQVSELQTTFSSDMTDLFSFLKDATVTELPLP